MATVEHSRATLDDLMRAEGKVELIGGRLIPYSATGRLPNKVAGRTYRSLDDYAMALGVGEAYTDNMGFAVEELSSGRESFSPNASYFAGPFPPNPMTFLDGPPTFAVEVRGENDYGPAAEAEMAAKRADYFEAGTPIVWDVDCDEKVIRSYRAEDPRRPTIFARGQLADAEPALPGWRVAVDRIFA